MIRQGIGSFSRAMLVGVASAGAIALAVSSGASAQTSGGHIIVAQSSNPPSLDAMVTSSQASRNINMNIYEQLIGFDESVRPIPILAESWELLDGGKTIRIPLRRGVKFHDGTDMTAVDVKASLERYTRVGATENMLDPVASIEMTGEYEITLRLKAATPTFIESFASPRAPAVIIPAEQADKGRNEIEVIGTGPYRFVEYVPDSHVKLERFDAYAQDTDHAGPDGFGGKKTAYLDTVTFRVMPEAGARVAALEAGEVHLVEQLPVPAARRLESNSGVTVHENMPWAMLTFIYNMKQAPSDTPKLRRAVQIALDMEEVMAIATEGLYRLDHGWQYPGTAYNAGGIGADQYNQGAIAAAKALVAESGYKGEEFAILTDSAYGEHNRAAVVIAERMKSVGINAVVKLVDWPTALQIRLQDEGWNGWTLMMGIEPFLGPYGLAATMTGKAPHMRVKDAGLEAAYQRLVSAPAQDDRVQAFADFQKRMYEINGITKLGDVGMMQATRSNVKGFRPYRFPRLYDVWFE